MFDKKIEVQFVYKESSLFILEKFMAITDSKTVIKKSLLYFVRKKAHCPPRKSPPYSRWKFKTEYGPKNSVKKFTC